ncbi:MAG: mucoidy inhibitor MuiA family protein [Xanthobacteraceae bacterium]|nr:mucoidy inhibitor MuiA family protein [Xanthobacteraceae bacterium]
MRSAAILALWLVAAPAAAAELDTQSRIDAVTVYPDGATVTRMIRAEVPGGDTTLVARDFPPSLDPASLRVEGEGRLVIGAIDARPPRPELPPAAPELERRLEALKDERTVLDDEIAAHAVRRRFAERFATDAPLGLGEDGDARPLAEWRDAFKAIAEEVAGADTAVRAARLKQRALDREIARLEAELKANPARKMEVRIDLSAEAATAATLRVSYTVRGARWVPLYDARLDTGTRERKPALELARRAEIVQSSGEDWSEVALAVSTVRTRKGGNAPELRPLIVRFQEPPRPLAGSRAAEDRMMAPQTAPAPGMAKPEAAREREAEIDTQGFQAVFRIPGRVSVASNEGAKSFRIATARLAPDLVVRATPALDPTGFLEAVFKHGEEAPLLPGRVALYRDNVFVGRAALALVPKDETVRLGFGADDRVKVAHTLVRKSEGTAGLITSSKVDEREFKIAVRNGHDRPVRVVVEDQLPVSEHADIQVEMLPGTTVPTEREARDRRGLLAWTLDLAPGEGREIRLAWRVRWPADKAVVFRPQPR